MDTFIKRKFNNSRIKMPKKARHKVINRSGIHPQISSNGGITYEGNIEQMRGTHEEES